MTAAMFDRMADDHQFDPHLSHDPTQLRPGTLVYLWRPGERPYQEGNRPVLARVQRATRNAVIGVDLADGAECLFDVAEDSVNPARLRWTWEVAAPPQRAAVRDGVERIDGAHMGLQERIRMICGEPGKSVRFTMRDGSSVSGVLTAVIQDDPEAREADWCQLEGPNDSRGQIKHWVRVPDITSITRTDD